MDMLPITIRKRTIKEEYILSIQAIVNDHWDNGRTEISRVRCEKWNWRQPNRRLRDMACKELLLTLGPLHNPNLTKTCQSEASYR